MLLLALRLAGNIGEIRRTAAMEFGIALFSNVDAWKTVKRAEELGFSHAWFYDSQLLAPDIFISMALAAEHSSKIKLASGVVIPTNRIAPVCADAFATLNKLAPGRIIFTAPASGRTKDSAVAHHRWAWDRCPSLSAMREIYKPCHPTWLYSRARPSRMGVSGASARRSASSIPSSGMINLTDKSRCTFRPCSRPRRAR